MAAAPAISLFWWLLIPTLMVVYMLPTLVGMIRRVNALPLVFLVNLIGGLTGVGWLGAMILAFGPRRAPTRSPASWSYPR